MITEKEKQILDSQIQNIQQKKDENKDKDSHKFSASKIFGRMAQAYHFTSSQPLFFDKNGIWWLWNFEENYWEIVDETEVLNRVVQHTQIDTVNSKAKTEILNALKQVGRLGMPKPMKASWIQFKDIIVDIETGKEILANPEFFVTNPIPWKLNKENRVEATPKMDALFTEWVGEEYVKTLHEILAYSLIPDYPIHRLFCFIGGGMNGKSCFLRLLRKFVGEKNVCSTELDNLLSSRFEVTRLHKKLVCMMGETNFNEISKTSILKKLTGQDVMGFEYKNKNPFEEVNYAKIMIATNNLPTTTDKTMGFYRRWIIIDFPNQFDEKQDILSTIPEEEYEHLAAKSVFILNQLLKDRKFTNEGDILDRMKKYESKSDFLQKFIEEFTKESDPNAYITKSEFSRKFKEWCKENKHRELGDKTLTQKMREKGIEDSKKHLSWMYDGKGGDARIWAGIEWK